MGQFFLFIQNYLIITTLDSSGRVSLDKTGACMVVVCTLVSSRLLLLCDMEWKRKLNWPFSIGTLEYPSDTFTTEVYGHLELISRECCRSRPFLVSLKTVHEGRVGGLCSTDDKQRVRTAFERAKNGFRNSLSALYISCRIM